MPGLVPGIHVLGATKQGVDGRNKPGHDGAKNFEPPNPLIQQRNGRFTP
jgi:hypothetical protein